jgi:uncharacterized protein (DUF2336 family)
MGKKMKIDYFGTQSEVIPVLVDMFDSQALFDLASDKSPKAREELVNKVIALLDVPLSMREKELAADILIDLMRQAERDLRAAIAQRLATMDDVPLRVMLSIARDEIDVAAPLLEHSESLNELDLFYVIKNTGAAHWRVIAKRKQMTDDLIMTLAQTNDYETALNIAENESLFLSEEVASVLVDLSMEQNDLAVPLARRNDVPKAMIQAIYNEVGDVIRQKLDGVLSKADLMAVDQTVEELSRGAAVTKHGIELPTKAQIQEAKAAKAKGVLNTKMLINTLKRKQTASFIAQFCVLTNLPVKRLLKALQETSGQKLAIVAKAFGFSRVDFIALYTLSAYIRGQNDAVQTSDVQRATEHYAMIGKGAAKQLLKNL